MRKINIGFISTTIKGAFDQEIARRNFKEAEAILNKVTGGTQSKIVSPRSMIITRDETRKVLYKFQAKAVDLIILHTACFASGEIAQEVAAFLKKHSIPIIIWGVPEPEGHNLTTNSFCCLNFYTSILNAMKVPYKWLFGSPQDKKTQEALTESIRVVKGIKTLRAMNIGIIGSSRVPGFYGSNFDELALKERFGVSINRIDLSEFFKRFKKISPQKEELKAILDKIRLTGTQRNLESSVKTYLTLREIVKERNLKALALRCWPEVREMAETEFCLPIALLCDEGIMCSDEADMLGLISMLMSYELTDENTPATLLDMVHFDEKKNTVGLWHCGASALSLARKECDVCLSPHPIVEQYDKSLKKGLVLEELLKEGAATLLRLQGSSGERYFVVEGEIIKTPMRFRGAYGDLRLHEPVMDVVNTIMREGVIHHYSLSYTHHKRLIKEFCYWLKIKPIQSIPYSEGKEPFGKFVEGI